VDPYLPLYVIGFAVFVGGGVLVGFVFKWWGLLASIGFPCFLVYAWEFNSEGIAYAAIGGVAASGAVVAGRLLRRRLRR
jgi:hypothetical protein